MKSKLVRIYGRVQGVFFRNNTIEKAQALGVCGWVRNRKDGSVEALIQAKEERDLQRLVDWFQEGPSEAVVELVDCEDFEATEKFLSFKKKRNRLKLKDHTKKH